MNWDNLDPHALALIVGLAVLLFVGYAYWLHRANDNDEHRHALARAASKSSYGGVEQADEAGDM